MIRYRCQVCGSQLQSPAFMAGETEVCPHCKTANWVPKQLAEKSCVRCKRRIEQAMASCPYCGVDQTPFTRTWIAIAGIVAGGLGIALVLGLWLRGRSPDIPTTEPPRVSAVMAAPLKHRVVEKKDVSYAGCPRMAYRVMLEVDRLPQKQEMANVARMLWEGGNRRWKEFYVFLYLPDMDPQSAAYAIAEFAPSGLKQFRVQEWALRGTRWERKG